MRSGGEEEMRGETENPTYLRLPKGDSCGKKHSCCLRQKMDRGLSFQDQTSSRELANNGREHTRESPINLSRGGGKLLRGRSAIRGKEYHPLTRHGCGKGFSESAAVKKEPKSGLSQKIGEGRRRIGQQGAPRRLRGTVKEKTLSFI